MKVITLTVFPLPFERGILNSHFRQLTFDFDQLRVEFEGQSFCSNYKSGSRKKVSGNSVIERLTMKGKIKSWCEVD
jgi:hypothetical protein